MFTIVQKYGGSSMATPAHIQEVARLIQKRLETGVRLCVVVSAMGKNTNQLLSLAHAISQKAPRRELDMLLSCGERASMALLAMALNELGIASISLTGSQSGIITDETHSGARIIEIRPQRVQRGLDEGKVVIIAGFQGVSRTKEITTLGRGGSDTTAVAMAAALSAEACEIYSDVAGVYSTDPKLIENPKHLEALSHDEMLEMAASGAKVLNTQAVEYAKFKGIEIFARKTGFEGQETRIQTQSIDSSRPKALSVQERLFCFRFEDSKALMALLEALQHLSIRPNQVVGAESGYCLINPEDAHGLEQLPSLPGIHQLADCSSLSLVGNGVGDNMNLLCSSLTKLKALQIPVLGLIQTQLKLYFLLEPKRLSEAASELYMENIQ